MKLADVKPIRKPKTIDAHGIGMETLVGVMSKEFPLKNGNCFSVYVGVKTRRKEMQVLNFCAENMHELIKRKMVTWPIRVAPAGDHHCYIHDERIPEEWYCRHVCSTCTPLRLQSPNDQLRRFREFARGERTAFTANGRKMEMTRTTVTAKSRALNMKFTADAQTDLKGSGGSDPGYVYAPYTVVKKEPTEFAPNESGILVPKKKKE